MAKPMKFRKKPVVIEALQFDGTAASIEDVMRFLDVAIIVPQEDFLSGDIALPIVTLEGTMLCNVGDWIIRGVAGEFYPCKDAIFQATYEAVPEEE